MRGAKIVKSEKDLSTLNIGILALQGGVAEHARAVAGCGAAYREIKHIRQLSHIDALIIPGGESTTMRKLMVEYGLIEPIKRLAAQGLPIFGTCAGLILLAKEISGGEESAFGLMNIRARRNAFGRQIDSFEINLTVPTLGKEPFKAVFIRAPWIDSVGAEVKILACLDNNGPDCGRIVLAEEGNILVSAFHPELTADRRIHQYFLSKVKMRI